MPFLPSIGFSHVSENLYSSFILFLLEDFSFTEIFRSEFVEESAPHEVFKSHINNPSTSEILYQRAQVQ